MRQLKIFATSGDGRAVARPLGKKFVRLDADRRSASPARVRPPLLTPFQVAERAAVQRNETRSSVNTVSRNEVAARSTRLRGYLVSSLFSLFIGYPFFRSPFFTVRSSSIATREGAKFVDRPDRDKRSMRKSNEKPRSRASERRLRRGQTLQSRARARLAASTARFSFASSQRYFPLPVSPRSPPVRKEAARARFSIFMRIPSGERKLEKNIKDVREERAS